MRGSLGLADEVVSLDGWPERVALDGCPLRHVWKFTISTYKIEALKLSCKLYNSHLEKLVDRGTKPTTSSSRVACSTD